MPRSGAGVKVHRMAPLPDDTAEDCLARAEYAARQATKARTDKDRCCWLEIAQEWRAVAQMKRTFIDRKDTIDTPETPRA